MALRQICYSTYLDQKISLYRGEHRKSQSGLEWLCLQSDHCQFDPILAADFNVCLTWLHIEYIVANADHQSLEQSLKPPSPAVVMRNVNAPDGVQIQRGWRLSTGWRGYPRALRCSLRLCRTGACLRHQDASAWIRPCSFTWETSVPRVSYLCFGSTGSSPKIAASSPQH